MFHLPFSLFCGARAWSHPISRWQLPALARHRGPTAPRQLYRGTAEAGEQPREQTLKQYLQRQRVNYWDSIFAKKKKKPTEQAYQLTSVTYDQNSANAKYPISMLLLSKESLEFGLFHRQSVCAISEAKRKSGRGARCS